jgi:hypothetical protein
MTNDQSTTSPKFARPSLECRRFVELTLMFASSGRLLLAELGQHPSPSDAVLVATI